MKPLRTKNLNVVAPCIVVIGIMLGLVAYSPKLYRLFCAATGFAGTTQRAESPLARSPAEWSRFGSTPTLRQACHGDSNLCSGR